MKKWRAWAYVDTPDLVPLFGKLIQMGYAWIEVADNRGGNGHWLVTVKVGNGKGPQLSQLPKSQKWTEFA